MNFHIAIVLLLLAMKYTLLIGIFGAQSLIYNAFGQQDPTIAQWISLHPTVHIMSQSNYEQLDLEFKNKLEGNVVVYQDKITIQQLLSFDGMEKTHATNQGGAKDEDLQLVKEWLAIHPDTKVIKRSEFNAMSSDEQSMYESSYALVLEGEFITAKDVRNYQY